MKLYLYGHEYKYAVEQMLLTLFPSERPEYPDGKPSGDRFEIKLSEGNTVVTATCKIVIGEESYLGKSSCGKDELSSPILRDRISQSLVKNAVYRAALRSGIERPVWGSLSGVRPGKVFSPLLEEGMSNENAVKTFMRKYDVSEARARLCLRTSLETIKAEKSLEKRDVCLYVGIPFCPTRCAYCSFVSQSVEKSMKLIPPFLEALYKEIAAVAEQVRKIGLRVISIYMGGGTPTTLSAEQLDKLCSLIDESFDLSALREYTVEAGRPDTITEEKLKVLRRHNVDRISVNPQTMSDKVLETIGRRHSAQDIIDAIILARKVGGFAINMDLIAGLPDDSVDGFADTLSEVLALSPENITIHTLALKKGSKITLEGSPIPTAAEVGSMLDNSRERLDSAGYFPYYLYRQKFMSGGFENVGWSKEGYVNLYNIFIMEELCSILAVGGGGSTKLVCPGDSRNLRIMAPKYPLEYINNIEKTCQAKEEISAFYETEVK